MCATSKSSKDPRKVPGTSWGSVCSGPLPRQMSPPSSGGLWSSVPRDKPRSLPTARPRSMPTSKPRSVPASVCGVVPGASPNKMRGGVPAEGPGAGFLPGQGKVAGHVPPGVKKMASRRKSKPSPRSVTFSCGYLCIIPLLVSWLPQYFRTRSVPLKIALWFLSTSVNESSSLQLVDDL